MPDEKIKSVLNELEDFISQPNALRSLIILLASVIIAFLLSRFIAKLILLVAKRVAARSDNAATEAQSIKLRRVETYFSVGIAIIRAIIVGVVAAIVWQAISPTANTSTAAIGASAFFIVIAGATIGMILRDVTAGSAMIIERWFDVGDFIRVEPFLDADGVVERVTLRSTKLRNIRGEVVWMHNQHIQAVKVTPRGLRTTAVDVFVNDKDNGLELIKKAVSGMPISRMTVTETPNISKPEQWAESLWLITITGKTPPEREWLIEEYLVTSLKELDAASDGKSVMVRQPLVRAADPDAERSFRRAVRANTQ